MNMWLTMIAIGVATFLLRLSFISLLGKVEVPDLVRRGLRFVPPAVLTAIILPELIMPDATLDISPANDRLIAGLLAAVVAWRTKNVVLTILAGMLILYILQAFG